MFDEFEFEKKVRDEFEKVFFEEINKIEHSLQMQYQAMNWKYVKTAKRTVIFPFGEMTLYRKCYKKNNEYIYPLDLYLNLEKKSRFSNGFLYQVANLSTKMSYREVVETIRLLKGVYITKDTVLKSVQLAQKLYEEKEDYEYYQEEIAAEKKEIETLYIEGDGVMIKTKSGENLRTDLTHFVVHEGKEIDYGGRYKLINKKEFISLKNSEAREKLIHYIDQHYTFKKESCLISNSDMGHGYTAYVFHEISKVFKIHHEHFWDKYHLYAEIDLLFNRFETKELVILLKESIQAHDKKQTALVLETIESLVLDEAYLNQILLFKKKLLNNFAFTKEAKLRGIDETCIGIMESQHCKITNRMKNRKMNWSKTGAEAMAKMIIDSKNDELQSLFMGKWRKEYQKMQLKYLLPVSYFLNEPKNKSEISSVRFINQHNGLKKQF
ncbi:ISLre2 family transposase [uncultured Granulicatella sp.]|uniref:ISLre2 family transposase n=1 Tax=uncultured Granulicatella sp. TaxID=316089 RepID=UPI0028D7994D|nr:ISLre2 family transposase [uncultured Granulicatella sp.]